MIVVDTNIIGYLYLNSDRSAQAEQVLRKDPQWAAPLLWRSELRNVLALYMRRDLLSLQDAQQIMDEATTLMQNREYTVTSFEVLNTIPVNEILTRMNLWLPGLGTSVFLSLRRDFVLPRAIFDEEDSQVVSKSEFTVQSVPKCRCTDTE